MTELRFEVPKSWHLELKQAAEAQALTLSSLLRIIVRSFLRGRYTDAEREALR